MFFATAGRFLLLIVGWYLQHQVVLNAIVVAYGIIVAISHRNLRRIDRFLTERCNQDPGKVLQNLAGGDGHKEIETVRSRFRFPLIAPPNGLWPLTPSRKHLLHSLARLHRKARIR